MFYAFFWVIPRRLNFIWRRFGKHCLFHLQRQVGMLILRTSPPTKMEQPVPKRRHIKFRRQGKYFYFGVHNTEKYFTCTLAYASVFFEVCHPRCVFKLYGEVNSVKHTTINIWLNDGVYWQWKNYMFRPIAAIFRF